MALGSGRFGHFRQEVWGVALRVGGSVNLLQDLPGGTDFCMFYTRLFESLLQYNEELTNYDSSRNRFASPLFVLST